MIHEACDTVKSDARQVASVSLCAYNPVFAFDTPEQAQTLTQTQIQTQTQTQTQTDADTHTEWM